MNNKITSGFVWSYGERITAQLVSFIVSVVLARHISPDEFGLISLVMIFINLCNVFVTSGLGSGLIQKKEVDETDFSTVFWFSVLLGIGTYLLIFLCAPLIEHFFDYENLTVVIRVMGLRLILASVNTIQHAYVSRKMIFRKFFFATLFGTVISAFVGIFMARHGFGIWAIVAQYLCNTTVDTLVLAIAIDWHPKFIFKPKRISYFFSFGWKVLAASLIDNLYTNLRSFLIGKKYSSADLAYYNKGMQFPSLIVTNINSTIIKVMFPAFSKEQNDKDKLRNSVKSCVQISSYILSPMLIGLMVVAKPLVSLLLTDKWLSCVPYIYIFALTYLFMPIHAINEQAIKATGHSEVSLKVEIIKKLFGIAAIIVFMLVFDSAFALAVSFLVYSLVALIINSLPGKRLYNYGCFEQIKDVFIQIVPSIIMAFVISMWKYAVDNSLVLMVLQLFSGLLVYLLLSVVLRNKTFFLLWGGIKKLITERGRKSVSK